MFSRIIFLVAFSVSTALGNVRLKNVRLVGGPPSVASGFITKMCISLEEIFLERIYFSSMSIDSFTSYPSYFILYEIYPFRREKKSLEAIVQKLLGYYMFEKTLRKQTYGLKLMNYLWVQVQIS